MIDAVFNNATHRAADSDMAGTKPAADRPQSGVPADRDHIVLKEYERALPSDAQPGSIAATQETLQARPKDKRSSGNVWPINAKPAADTDKSMLS